MSQMEEIFQCTTCPKHIESKFQGYCRDFHGNGTQGFFKWFMELDGTNKDIVLSWIEINYNHKHS
jgi:hypothetical protein